MRNAPRNQTLTSELSRRVTINSDRRFASPRIQRCGQRGGSSTSSMHGHSPQLGPAYGLRRGPWPGLILEWRRTNTGDRTARVVYVPDHRASRSVEDWFAPSNLRPIDA